MPTFGRKPCPECPGTRPPYPPCNCVGVPDYGDSTAVPSAPWPPPSGAIPPVGCICPPTSEKTCQNPECPRKPRTYVATSYVPTKPVTITRIVAGFPTPRNEGQE